MYDIRILLVLLLLVGCGMDRGGGTDSTGNKVSSGGSGGSTIDYSGGTSGMGGSDGSGGSSTGGGTSSGGGLTSSDTAVLNDALGDGNGSDIAQALQSLLAPQSAGGASGAIGTILQLIGPLTGNDQVGDRILNVLKVVGGKLQQLFVNGKPSSHWKSIIAFIRNLLKDVLKAIVAVFRGH